MLAFVFSVAVLFGADAQPAVTEAPVTETPATAANKAAPTEAKPQDPQDRVICKKEHVPGSNRPQKICMTVREWEAGGAEGATVRKK